MAKLILRPAEMQDVPALAYIQTQAWKAAFGDILASETLAQATNTAEAETMYRYVLEHHLAHVFIQYVDGAPQGIAAWSANRDHLGSDTAELICIHSLPQFWGHGYASHVMEHLVNQVRAAGYTRLVLWVFEANLRARAFYEKHGFEQSARSKDTLGAKEVLYTMDL